MNLKFTGEAYANAQGLSLREPGVYEIDDATARVLLDTYPQWFEVTDVLPKSIEAEIVEEGTDETAKDVSDLENETDEPVNTEVVKEAQEAEPKVSTKPEKVHKATTSRK